MRGSLKCRPAFYRQLRNKGVGGNPSKAQNTISEVKTMYERPEFVFFDEERTQAEPKEKCSQQFAQNAVRKLKFLSDQRMTDLFIAVNVSQREKKLNN